MKELIIDFLAHILYFLIRNWKGLVTVIVVLVFAAIVLAFIGLTILIQRKFIGNKIIAYLMWTIRIGLISIELLVIIGLILDLTGK